MRTRPWFAVVLVVGATMAGASASHAEDAAQPAASAGIAVKSAQPAAFTPDRLDQLVAPIALYPDSLLTHILMASTYPLEIVEASRWLKKNPALKDAALEEALKKQDWDPSVKAVCAVPAVVEMMNENLDWMKDLGDAFLGQQAEVLTAAQRMRAKAYEAGNLKSSEQQVVTQDDEKVIIIESANPDVIYVPSYSPAVVYGGWQYPTYYYPTMYVPPPPGVGFMTFTAGVFWGAAVVGHADWHNHGVYGGPPPPRPGGPGGPPGGPRPGGPPPGGPGGAGGQRPGGPPPGGPQGQRPGGPQGGPPGGSQGQAWQHNPEHRKGVNYQNPATAQKFGGTGASNQVTRDQARGRSGQQPGAGGGAPSGSRPPAGSRPSGGGPSAATRDVSSRPSAPSGGAASRPATSDRSYSSSGGSRNSAYSGSRTPSSSMSSSSRGASSRGTSSYSGSASRSSSGGSRPSGGGSRPSGGGGGGRSGGGRR